MRKPDGKFAIIMGSGQRLGHAAACKFAREGAPMVVSDIRQRPVSAEGFIDTTTIKTGPEKVIRSIQKKIALPRIGSAGEIGNAHAFLASNEASEVDAAALTVTGGATV